MDTDKLAAMLIEEEGIRLNVYTDSEGVPTIGVGRNLRDKGITRAEAETMLKDDIADTVEALYAALPYFGTLDEVRQRVLADMAFNLGIHGLLGFQKMLDAISPRRDYDRAAGEMLRSRWAQQVGARARRLAQMMRTSVDQPL